MPREKARGIKEVYPHFHAEELVWECKSGIKCECMRFDQQQQHGQRERRGQPNETGWLKDSLSRVSKTVGSFESAGYLWLDIVSEFSALLLTHESDRLPALSGLADYFSNGNLGAYLAGVWEKDLACGLLFQRSELLILRIACSLNRLRLRGHGLPLDWTALHLFRMIASSGMVLRRTCDLKFLAHNALRFTIILSAGLLMGSLKSKALWSWPHSRRNLGTVGDSLYWN